MAFVYILQDTETKRHYIGSCLEISTRIKRHQKHTGGVTTSKGDWKLLCLKEFATLKEARDTEKLLKSYKGGNSFKRIVENWRVG